MPLSDKRIKSSWGGAYLVDKDTFKDMTSAAKEELVDSFKKECLMASSDVQGMIDFTTELIYIVKEMPLQIDLTKLQAAITGKNPEEAETADKLDYTSIQTKSPAAPVTPTPSVAPAAPVTQEA